MNVYVITTDYGLLIGVYLHRSKADRMLDLLNKTGKASLVEREINEET